MSVIVSTEADILAAVLQWLNTIPHCRAFRRNTGAVLNQYTSKRTGKITQRLIRYGEPGMADIWGMLRGYHLEIEIKRPGEHPNFEQINWLMRVRNEEGIAFWADSLRSCGEQLRYEFSQRGWKWLDSWECW